MRQLTSSTTVSFVERTAVKRLTSDDIWRWTERTSSSSSDKWPMPRVKFASRSSPFRIRMFVENADTVMRGLIMLLQTKYLTRAVAGWGLIFLLAAFVQADEVRFSAASGDPIVIGLDADMSSGSAEAGEAIRRGTILAISEINATGGVLGRPLELMVGDHRGNPARGIDNLEEFAKREDLVAVMGGLHTPVLLAELETIHRHKLVSLVPWAAGTPIIDNGYEPNYVFRVSVRDEFAGGVLIGHARRSGYSKPGLLLERTGWGRSNQKAITNALTAKGLTTAGTNWFDWGIDGLATEIESLIDGGADCLLLVCNPREGVVALRSMAALPMEKRVPIISHWGITGGGRKFFKDIRDLLDEIDLVFLQSFSFLAPPFEDRASHVCDLYRKAFSNYQSPKDIFSPVGTAHAYELVHMLAKSIRRANSIERPKVREALERLGKYKGLIRNYDPPFSPDQHDALTPSDLHMCRFAEDGAIVPIETPSRRIP